MGLYKAIEHGKEYRKQYRKAKSISHYCRNHGGCSWCLENRVYSSKKRESAAAAQLEEYNTQEVD